jgi:hypothetical protein
MDFIKITEEAFINELEKIAKKRDKIMGVGAIGTGAITLNKAKSLLTGRKTLYHGTTSKAYSKILKEGIKPPNKKKALNTDVFKQWNKNLHKNSVKFVYLSPDKKIARQFAVRGTLGGTLQINKDIAKDIVNNNSAIKNVLNRNVKLIINSMNPFYNKNIVKANIPIWNKKYTAIPNPEASLQDFTSLLNDEGGEKVNSILKFLSNHQVKEFNKKYPAFKSISPEYIKGSKKYIPFYKDLGKYIKAKPGSFAKGLGLAAAGTGIAGLGIKQLLKKKEEK